MAVQALQPTQPGDKGGAESRASGRQQISVLNGKETQVRQARGKPLGEHRPASLATSGISHWNVSQR